jgi:hypothetical protein
MQKSSNRILKAYAKRNAKLRELGYPTYAHYLQSPIWADIRKRVLDRDCSKCWGCKGVATQVHHGHYGRENLLGLDISDLWSVCRKCHEACEFATNGRKRAVHTTVKALLRRTGKHCSIKRHRRERKQERTRELAIQLTTLVPRETYPS